MTPGFVSGYVLLGVITLSVFFYRPFCKWICPLGAFYALFHKLSFYKFNIDKKKCTGCGVCSKVCKMDVDVYKTPNHTECIRCGDCVNICPHGAICKSIKSGKACMLSLAACGNGKIQATIKPFPKFEGVDFTGNTVNNNLFKDYDVTVVNFWSNGCGSCIAEMPELKEYYQDFKNRNINLVAVAVSGVDSKEERARAEEILKEKGVTYQNIIPTLKVNFIRIL